MVTGCCQRKKPSAIALSTLRGPFDLAAAASLTQRPADVARAHLAALAAESLTQRLPDGRQRLFTAVRELAAEALDDDLRARHAAHFADLAAGLAREVQHGDAGAATAALQAVLDDLSAALDASPTSAQRVSLVAGLDAALMASGGTDALDATLAHTIAAVADDPTSLVRAYALRARGRYLRGHVTEAWADVTAALAAAGADDRARWEARLTGSATLRSLLRYDEALAEATAVFDAAQAAGEAEVALRARHQMACAMLLRGDDEAAKGVFLEALAAARATGARRVEALCLTNLGVAALRRGEHEAAALRLAQGEAAFEAIGDALLAAKLAVHRAHARLEAGAAGEALALLDGAATRARELRDAEMEAEATVLRARCLEAVGRRAEARVAREDAVAAARALGLDEIVRGEDATNVLRVGAGAYWFAVGAGERVALGRRPNLRRVLALLVERRAARDDRPATAQELFEAGWPGDRALPEAAAERVYTAVRTLRAMGLRALLVRRDGGYALDPGAALLEG